MKDARAQEMEAENGPGGSRHVSMRRIMSGDFNVN